MGSNVCYLFKYLMEFWRVLVYKMIFQLFNAFILSIIAVLTLYVESSSHTNREKSGQMVSQPVEVGIGGRNS